MGNKKLEQKRIGFLFGCELILRGDKKFFDDAYNASLEELKEVIKIYFKDFKSGHHPNSETINRIKAKWNISP